MTLVALGLAFNSQKLYAEARAPLLRSLEIEPDNLEGLAALAESEDGTGELAAAETHAERVLARQPRQRDRQPGDGPRAHEAGALRRGARRSSSARSPPTRCPAEAHYQLSLACARLGDAAGQEKHLALYQRGAAGGGGARWPSCAARAPGRAPAMKP